MIAGWIAFISARCECMVGSREENAILCSKIAFFVCVECIVGSRTENRTFGLKIASFGVVVNAW